MIFSLLAHSCITQGQVNLHIFKEAIGNLSCSRELLYQCVPGLYGGRPHRQHLWDFASLLGCLHRHTAGKEFGVAAPGEHPELILSKAKPKDCSWPVPEPGGRGRGRPSINASRRQICLLVPWCESLKHFLKSLFSKKQPLEGTLGSLSLQSVLL